MEIKATLQKPYEEKDKLNFIVNYNHNLGYTINETDSELQALGYTEDELVQKEQERIAKLSLTKREVFLGLYQAKGVTPDIIKTQIKDPQALIEFEYANDYFRGNPLIDIVGASLGITPKQLDKFFETNDYKVLLPIEEPENEGTEDTTEPIEPEQPTEVDEPEEPTDVQV